MDFEHISYEAFGVNFVSQAVTPERVAEAIAQVAGDSIEVGPMAAGPGGVATVTATGKIGAVEVQQGTGPILNFRVTLPIDLELDVRLAGVSNRYEGRVEIPLDLTVRAAAPLALVIEIAEVANKDVHVNLKSFGVGAQMLQRVGDLDGEVRRQVAKTVNKRLSSEQAVAARTIDVGALIDKAMPS